MSVEFRPPIPVKDLVNSLHNGSNTPENRQAAVKRVARDRRLSERTKESLVNGLVTGWRKAGDGERRMTLWELDTSVLQS